MFLQKPEITTRTATALTPRLLLAGVLALSEVALAAEPLTRIADIRGLERGEPAQALPVCERGTITWRSGREAFNIQNETTGIWGGDRLKRSRWLLAAHRAGQRAGSRPEAAADSPADGPGALLKWCGRLPSSTFSNILDFQRSATVANSIQSGIRHLLEFALNGNPTNPSINGYIASLVQDSTAPAGNEMTLIVAVRDGATFVSGANGVRSASVDGITLKGKMKISPDLSK